MVFIVLGVSLGFSTVAKDTVVKSDNWTIENPTIKLFGENPEGEKITERKDQDLPNLRTMFSKTFENEDGTYSQESFFTPINYQDENGSWQPIDSRIVHSDDPTFDYMNETNIFKTYFTIDPFGNKQNVKYQVGDAWMTFRSLSEVNFRPSIEEGLSLISQASSTNSQSVIKDLKYADLKKEFTKKRTRKLLGLWERYAPKTQELGHIPSNQKNTLRYGKILEISQGETIDIDYSIKPLNLLEEIILNTPQNIGSFSQEVLLNNAYAKKEGESISFYNKKTDEKIWSLSKPVMYEYFERWNEDIKNPSRFENFGLHYEIECKNPNIEIQDCNNLIISKVIDEEGKTWLNDTSRQYPVAIDLTVNYDFTDTTDNWAYNKGASLPTSPTDAGLVAATTTNYTNLSTSTNTWWTTSLATTTGQYDSQIYRFTIDQIISEIASINVQWEGYGEVNGTSTTDLKVWKNASSTWQQLDSIDFSTTTDQVASGTISTNISNYIDASTTFSVLASTQKGPLANGAACSSAGECNSNFCVDNVCCNSACNTETCERCDSYSNAGTGTCGYVNSSSEDPDNQCPGAFGACTSATCSGTSKACGYLADGEQSQAACKRCNGSSFTPVNMTNNAEDNEGSNLCTGTCYACQSGSCSWATASTDPDDDCNTGAACYSSCREGNYTGNCGGSSSCAVTAGLCCGDYHRCSGGACTSGSCRVFYSCINCSCTYDP